VNGYPQKPLEGVSFAASFDDPSADTGKQTQFYSMLGTRALWHQGWKAASLGPSAPNAWGHFSGQRWELFNTDQDPSECHDLAAAEPGRLRELIDMWWVEAGKYQALPQETRTAVEAFTTPRPEMSKPRTRYTYFPGGAEVPESQAPNIRGRSYTIAVEVDIDSEDASGVLSRQRVPTGHVVLSASFDREGDTMPAQGMLSLYIRDQKAGEGSIRTQPGKFGLGGGGLVVGQSGAEPITDDYAGQRPWAFTGGTVKRVVIDVSGQAFVDLAREAAAAFARQ
jgi:hypothetical protein